MTAYVEDIAKIFKFDLVWSKFNGANILVTGATGLIGGCLVDALMMNPNRNYHVYASGRNVERAQKRFQMFENDNNFHFIQYDVMQPFDSDINFDYIIHAASDSNPIAYSTQPVEIMKANFLGVSNLIEYGSQHQMKRFLYVSSGEVYGEGDGRIVTEEYSGYVNCATPRACYPSSKRASETLCMAYASEYGVDVVIARPCHVYGPFFTESDSRVYAQFIRNVLNGEDIVMKSTGEQFRSWCYVVDCVSAILHILLKGKSGEAYNVADMESNITIKELADLVAEYGRKKVVIDIPDEVERKGYTIIKKAVFSTEKLEELGWMAQTHIREGLNSTIQSIKTIKNV